MKWRFTLFFIGCLLCFLRVTAQQSSFEIPARKWIDNNSRSLGIQSFSELKLHSVKKSNSGETLRFQQMIHNIPVFQAEIIIHFNKSGKITYTSSDSYKRSVQEIDTTPVLSYIEAADKAHGAAKIKGDITYEDNKLFVWVTDKGETKLVYRVVTNSYESPESWETIVDAKIGEILSIKNIALYHHGNRSHSKNPKKNKKNLEKSLSTGNAYIYNPDPLSKTGTVYGGQYVDNNDATNSSLDNARSLVTLSDITYMNNLYMLKNSYVEIKDLSTPNTGLFSQATSQFLFNRSELGFEAVNAFWHIDNSLRYINETLGIVCRPETNSGVVFYDPHALDGADNSRYTVAGTLEFGQGNVDDAEDADVILHELGHGIHHWLSGGLSNNDGLSEGVGDYWAQSYSRSLNQWNTSSPQYNWVYNWDGHNEFWNGRITNSTMLYPGSGSFYDRAQIWASALMRIYDKIGKEKIDRALLEGLMMTSSASTQQEASIAVRQAAIDMLGKFGFTCEDIVTITNEFKAAGYTLPAYKCEGKIDEEDGVSIYPNPVSDILIVTLKLDKEENVIIYNMEGRRVMETILRNGENRISVSSLSSGVYVLTIKSTKFSSKFIKK
ncbi:T9SS type A sorting domain-containing protein [Chryseobacterium sp.]|uniref:T9SS type A sorting domain-containing protein n=1 Tax=Chryseobacterium sp. TaxID=1871047 RepID=UPI0025BD7CC0|nr:T9SS type A sorting domain-containing protein [Chryseobacterium sp.]